MEISVNGTLDRSATVDQNTGQMISIVDLDEGRNQIVLVTVNAVGLRSDALTLNTTLDTQAPQVETILPKDGTSVTNATEIRAMLYDSTVADSTVSGINRETLTVTLTRVEKVIEGAIEAASDPVALDEPDYNEASGTLTVGLAETLENLSKYTVQIGVEDKAGNSAAASSTFRIDQAAPDTSKPEIFAINPAEGAVLNGDELANLAIRASIFDASGLAEVNINLDGAPLPLGLDANPLPTQIATWTFEFKPAEALEDKAHRLTIYAKDGANPANEQTVTVDFTVESSTPKPVFDAAAISSRQSDNGILLLNLAGGVLVGNAEPEASVAFSVNNQPAGTTKVDADGRFSKTVQLNDGLNQIVATATKNGNSAQSNPLIIQVDTNPPTLGNASPEPGLRTRETTITMVVEIADDVLGSGIDPASLDFVLDGNRRISPDDFSFDAGKLSYTKELAEGNHFFRVTAADFAGNRQTFNSGVFTVDLTAPTVSRFAPANGATVSNPTLEISAIIDDDDVKDVGLQLLSVDAPETPIPGQGEFKASSGRLSFKPDSALANGTYQATVVATDIAGNTSDPNTSSLIFGIDTEYDDSTGPDVVPRFPKEGQAISTASIKAIKFEVLDADAGVDFSTMTVTVNGVEVDMTGGAVLLNRETGTVPDYEAVRASTVEIRLNGSIAGMASVDEEGTFFLEHALLAEGTK